MAKALSKVLVECGKCGRRSTLDGADVASRVGEPLSMNNVGQLYGKLRCSACCSRDIRISDDGAGLLVDPACITPCRVCGCPILLPRLKAIPGTDRCAACAAEGAKPPRPTPYPQPPADKRRCPRCGSPTIVRQRREDEGFFLGCTGFPSCRWTQALSER